MAALYLLKIVNIVKKSLCALGIKSNSYFPDYHIVCRIKSEERKKIRKIYIIEYKREFNDFFTNSANGKRLQNQK